MIKLEIRKDNEWAVYVQYRLKKSGWNLKFNHIHGKRWPASVNALIKHILKEQAVKVQWRRTFSKGYHWNATHIYFDNESEVTMARLLVPHDFRPE